MRKITHINIDESIGRGKLVYESDWVEIRDAACVYLGSLGLIIAPILNLFTADLSNVNDYFISVYVFPLATVFGLIEVYRQSTQKNLDQISSPKSLEENHRLLLEYGKSNDYEIERESENCIILQDNYSLITNSKMNVRYYIFIVSKNDIYFCTLNSHFKINFPVILHYWLVKRDIKKLVKQKEK